MDIELEDMFDFIFQLDNLFELNKEDWIVKYKQIIENNE